MNTIKIAYIDLIKLSNDSHLQFHIQEKRYLQKSGIKDITKNAVFTQYCKAIETESGLKKKIIKSEFTELIKLADANRDNAYRSITEITTANTRNFESDIKESAVRIKIVLNTYGKVTKFIRSSINAQTSAVRKILREFNGKYKEDVIKIGIDKWIIKLEEFNNEVESLMQTRYNEYASKITIPFRKQRKVVDNTYYAVVKHLEALITLNGSAQYIDLVNSMNIVMEKYNIKRTSSKASESNSSEPAEEPAETTNINVSQTVEPTE